MFGKGYFLNNEILERCHSIKNVLHYYFLIGINVNLQVFEYFHRGR